jgi:Na+-driven multidrug efflux pump
LTGSFAFLVLGFAQGMAAGFGIVLSQYVGAKNVQKMKGSIATSLLLCLIVGVLGTILAVSLARPVLELMGTDERYLEYSVGYARATFTGLLFTILYNYGDQVLRAMGDSKTPLFVLILCAVLNLGLNSLMFAFEDLTVAWAGYATIISQFISALVEFIVIFKKFPEIRLKRADFKQDIRFAMHHIGMGLPMSIQFVITASGCMVQQRAFNTLSDPLCAMAQSNVSKIDNVFGSFLNGAGTAMATYVGQNYGARDYDRIKKGYFASLGVGAIFTAFSMTLMFTLSVPMTKLLLPAESIIGDANVVYDYALRYAVMQASFYWFLFMIFQLRQCVQAIGNSITAMFGGVVEFSIRAIIAGTFAKWWGFAGACLSNPLAWVGTSTYLLIAFIICFRKLLKSETKEV